MIAFSIENNARGLVSIILRLQLLASLSTHLLFVTKIAYSIRHTAVVRF
jgi:hypothetical protein